MEIPVLNQSPVRFESEGHKYWLGEKELDGITSTLVKRAYPDTYKKPDRYTDDEWQAILDNAAEKGSNMHETIELYDELGAESDSPELASYIRIKNENGLVPIASEYLVSDEESYATAIDKVMMTPEGEIVLVDFKRTYSLHVPVVTCQLSICKRFFERQNPELTVSAIYAMWLRDEKSRFEKLNPWTDEMIDDLIAADRADKKFDIVKTYGNLPAMFDAVQDEIARYEMLAAQAKELLEKLRGGLYEEMEKTNLIKWSGDKVTLTRVLPSKSKSFDSRAFKKDHPELYAQYVKETEKAGYLRVTLTKKQ